MYAKQNNTEDKSNDVVLLDDDEGVKLGKNCCVECGESVPQKMHKCIRCGTLIHHHCMNEMFERWKLPELDQWVFYCSIDCHGKGSVAI